MNLENQIQLVGGLRASHFVLILITAAGWFPGVLMAQNEDLSVTYAYVRSVPPTLNNTAAYLTVHNTGKQSVTITGVRCDAAHKAELHESKLELGVMKMRPVPSLTITAGDTTVLQPGGIHIMLIDLKQALTPGDNLTITLELASGETVDTMATVRDLRAESGSAELQHEHHH